MRWYRGSFHGPLVQLVQHLRYPNITLLQSILGEWIGNSSSPVQSKSPSPSSAIFMAEDHFPHNQGAKILQPHGEIPNVQVGQPMGQETIQKALRMVDESSLGFDPIRPLAA